MTIFSILLGGLLGAQGGAMTVPGNTAIDYASVDGIRDWHAEDKRGIYLRDRTNRWYYAAFQHECPGVLYNPTVRFDTNGDHRFDRLSRVITQTEVCGIASVQPSAAPAAKGGRN